MLFRSEFVSSKDWRHEDEFRIWSITKCPTLEHGKGTIRISWELASYGEVSIWCHTDVPFLSYTCICFWHQIFRCECNILLWNCQTSLFIAASIRFVHWWSFQFMICSFVVPNSKIGAFCLCTFRSQRGVFSFQHKERWAQLEIRYHRWYN
jgi:hypothetical protein